MYKPGQGSSHSKRAVAAREWRGHDREKRRFNTLLNGFIGVKYTTIYSEYKDFYNMMKRSHPQAGNLTKTKSYKRWKKEHTEAAPPRQSRTSSKRFGERTYRSRPPRQSRQSRTSSKRFGERTYRSRPPRQSRTSSKRRFDTRPQRTRHAVKLGE